ncbi:hypothetical protein A3715_11880 [Oleiphilus sp. HI0009]|nr:MULTISPECIES: flagellar biosynthesis protein FlhF [unclassified Oleiphilus]KZX76991.1 hypothetical protein A3715_11880 [Oleiphilus sp. HI0009]KZY70005.1 hypothetical protein A3739_07345 [Oleiphilus sp. HI0067]
MKVKRYFSHSMQDALRQIREDLGPDAVILSNSKTNGGVEILATAEYEDQPEQGVAQVSNNETKVSASELAKQRAERSLELQAEMDRSRRRIESVKQEQNVIKTEQFGQTNKIQATPAVNHDERSSKQDDAIYVMQEELRELREMISAQAKQSTSQQSIEPMPQAVVTPSQSIVDERLERLAIQQPIRKQLLDSVASEGDSDTAWAKVRKQIHGAIQTEYSEIIDMGGVISLVGPTGSGKTMTIGKLAARYVMRHGADGIALVTTDRYRIAAHEQLKVFGRILNVPVHVVDEDNCLDAILDKCSDRKLVLVDTAGLMQSDRSWNEQLKELKMSAHRIQNYLVMPATGQYAVMKANYKHYKMVGLAGTIITKLDEAVSFGEALSYLIASKLSCAYVTDGQRVPEDIHLAERQSLLNKAEELLNSSERWVTIPSHANAQQHVDESVSNFA